MVNGSKSNVTVFFIVYLVGVFILVFRSIFLLNILSTGETFLKQFNAFLRYSARPLRLNKCG